MYENNIDNFNFKPLTLVNFFPKNKRSKNSNKDNSTNSNYNHHNLGYTNSAHPNIEKNNSKKNSKASNSKYRYKIAQNSKTHKFNNFASSTSNNFYHNHNHNEYYYNNDNPVSNKKYSLNNYNYNNDNDGFRKSSHKKNRTKDKNKAQERIKSVFDANLYNFQNIENKDKNEQLLEQILDNYDSKFQRNMKDIKFAFNINNNKNKNSQRASNQNSLTSINYNMNNNEYINSLRFKNVIRLSNKDKAYDFLPYLHSSSKERKPISKAHKQLLVYENYNINSINAVFNPANGYNDAKNNNNIYSSAQTLTKNSISKSNNNKKNNFTHVSTNNVLNSFNNNVTSNSNISNTGNNNIIFNNMGSVNNNYNYNIYDDNSRKNINYFDEISRTNTAGKEEENYYNIFGKKTFSNGFYFAKRKDNDSDKEKVSENEKIANINDINENKKSNQKIIRNFNFLKEDKNNGKEKEKDSTNSNNNKMRALSTVPYKNRNKNSKKNTINIDCNNENKVKEKTNENHNKINLESSQSNHNKNNKIDKSSKYEIGESLGKGAYAVVKKIKNIITNEEYAVKIYEKEKLNSNSKKSCVTKEIQILKRLNHKNIAKLIEVITNEKQILVIQELVEGISLREYYNNEIRHQKGISIHKENIFRIIFKQIFEAMDYVHKQGMAHRDIKLENILIKKNYEIKIIDFGFGMYNPENKLQKFFCGTPNYMAPEIAEKKPYNGQLADMWSLGILVYKIFCADFPFKGKNEKELYKAIKTGKFTMASYTPEYAKKIICSLIVLNPNKRMTCEDVLNSDWLKDK